MADSGTSEVIVKTNIGLRKSFARAVLTSLTATAIDLVVSFCLTTFLDVYYVTATSLGGLCGAGSSFFMGRLWVFKKKAGKLKNQLIKFMFTNSVSIFLNTSGVFDIEFLWARIFVSIMVGFFFNFLMNRYFVFKS
jgi:putative flippase GtrA